MEQKEITLCVCASRDFIDRRTAADLAGRLVGAGYAVRLEPDLCGKVRDAAPEAFAAAGGAVVACYPRAVRAMFGSLGIPPPAEIFDIRNESAGSVLEGLGVASGEQADDPCKEEFVRRIAALPREDGSDPWFPVIDKERCGECEKCHEFCLFGVYAVEDGRVAVRNPANCKNNCPACARLCPSGAIIFPKYPLSPINGGLQDGEAVAKLDTGAIYNEALRERLAARRAAAGGVPLFKYDKR
jgi:NAD-dependent dihydropyrimidine dehydrogenase PreA subunit